MDVGEVCDRSDRWLQGGPGTTSGIVTGLVRLYSTSALKHFIQRASFTEALFYSVPKRFLSNVHTLRLWEKFGEVMEKGSGTF